MTEIINRENAEAIIREQVVEAITQDVPKSSTFMAMAKKLPNMTSKQTRIRVLDFLPTAYWVNGDTGMKQTSKQAWDNVWLTAAELAVIVPIPEAVLDDAEFDIMGEVTPRVIEAIGQRVDSAIIFGENRPAEWQNDIITLARQSGNNVAVGSTPNYYDKILGEDGVFAKVEDDGYAVSGVIAATNMKAKLRSIKDTTGNPIFVKSMQDATSYALDGTPMQFPVNGAFNNSIAQLVAGDFSQAVYSIRQDVTTKILTEGVIQDPSTKEIVYNLAQQDMIALRVVFRIGWALPNPATRVDEDRVGCPFAYLEPATPVTTHKATFTVTDNTEKSPVAIKDARVDVNGSKLKTDGNGSVEFNLRPGTYPYAVTATGKIKVSGTITVNSADITEAVTMIASRRYTSFSYYANEYCCGKPVVESADFHKLLIKAQGIIDMYTFNRLKESAEIVDEVQNCCCELVECINTYENGISEKPSGVSSEKIKNYSVTYESTENMKQRYDKEVTNIVHKWLGRTGLLYRGC